MIEFRKAERFVSFGTMVVGWFVDGGIGGGFGCADVVVETNDDVDGNEVVSVENIMYNFIVFNKYFKYQIETNH